jgi:hypothetical protein
MVALRGGRGAPQLALGSSRPSQTHHFLTLSMFVRDEWFHLARYHDFDHDKRGQAMLAEALGMAIDEVFPIRYDIGKWVSGVGADTVRGTVHAVP